MDTSENNQIKPESSPASKFGMGDAAPVQNETPVQEAVPASPVAAAAATPAEAVQATVKLGPALNPATAPAQETPAPAGTSGKNEAPQKKKGGCGKCILIAFLVLVFCCIATAGIGYYLMQSGVGSLGTASIDKTLTRFTSMDEANAEIKKVDSDNTLYTLDQVSGNVVFHANEKETLAILFKAAGITGTTDDPNAIGIDMEPEYLKLQIDLGSLLSKSNSESSWIKPESLKGVYASINVSIGSDGKTLVVNDVSVGNELLDSIVGDFLKTNFQTAFNNLISGGIFEGTELKGIKFSKDQLTITMSTDVKTTVTPTGNPVWLEDYN